MKKSIILVIILAVIIVILLAVFLLLPQNKKTAVIDIVAKPNVGIEVTFPRLGQVVSSPLKVTGKVNGSGWSGFEGQVGTVKLLDNTGKELASGVLKTTTDWTVLPTLFETDLTFNPGSLAAGQLIFHSENPSGDPLKDKIFYLPIRFK